MSNRKIFLIMAVMCGLIGGVIRVSWLRKSIHINNALHKNNVVHMAIVGSGPAGWSAAVYGARFGRNVLVVRGPKPGGVLTETGAVENWPGQKSILGQQLIGDIEQHARSLGVKCLSDTVESIDFNVWPFALRMQQGDTIHALSVIITTGGTPLKLGVPGEDKFWGKGVTSCAKCDAPFYKNEEVVVVGGGDSAVEEAIQLAPYAKKITILVRKDSMRATHTMRERLSQYPSISVRFNVEVKEIFGNESGVTGISLYDTKTQELGFMPITGLFLAIGHRPNTELVSSALKLDAQGYIVLHDGRSQKTSIEGVFAAGDVEDNFYRQAVVAAGSGVRAAIDADAFLTNIGLSPAIETQLRPYLFQDTGELGASYVSSIETIADFDALVNTGKLVVVDFFGQDCPQCIVLAPLFESVAKEYAQTTYPSGEAMVHFVKVDAQALLDLSDRLHIYKVPSILIFKNGDIVARFSRIKNAKELSSAIKRFIK